MKKSNVLIVLAVISLTFGINTPAQNMKEDFRKTAPAPLAPVPFNISRPFETTLSNGLKIVIFEDKRLPLVSYRLAFRTGDINDPKEYNGLTVALTAMLEEGTKSRSSRQLADQIERMGASISTSSTSDNTIIAASSLARYGSDVLQLLADVTLNPIFPENELKIFKQNTIEGLKFQRSQPGFLANEQINRVLYGAHPYSVTSQTPEDIEKITPQVLKAFHNKIFVSGNATMIVVGDVNRDQVIKEIKRHFGAWSRGKVETSKFTAPPVQSERTLTIVDRPGSAQSNIILSNLAIDRNSPDYFPVVVMNQVLGAGASARLFMNLREEKGYTYGAYSNIDARRLAGAFEATAEVRTPVTGDSLKEFFYELNRIREEKVPVQELQDAQNFLTGVFPIRAETQEGMTNLITSQQIFELPADYLQTYRDKVNSVTPDEVARVAKKYITPDQIAIVIVGDAEEILPQVKGYAKKIEIFDTEGTLKDINDYGQAPDAKPVDVSGKWDLEVDAQGQKIAVSLNLTQEGNKVSGELSSMLGKGEIDGGKVSGNKLNATAKTTIQGQPVEMIISGTIEAETMKGTLDTGFPGFPPVPFEGKRTEGGKPAMSGNSDASPARDISGSWDVETNAAGQPVSINIVFKQSEGKLSGTLTSDFGLGTVSDGTVSGDSVTATLIVDFQGQMLNVKLNGKIEAETEMNGTLTPEMPGIGDLPFKAAKRKQ